jgi:hypothetical protein
MEMLQLAFFALLSSYKTFRAAVNNNKYEILWVWVCILVLALPDPDRIFSELCYIVICGLSGSTVFFHII